MKSQLETNFFAYRGFLWLWINLLFLVILSYFYLVDKPLGGPNGGTFIGYLYGTLATAGILYLLWFGVRKRSYYARFTTLKGCLSAHVWLGLSLVIVVPLHSGFSFGFNVHTLAYVLMLLVILSGVWGSIQYVKRAPEIPSHRGGASLQRLLQEEELLRKEVAELAGQRSDAFVSLSGSLLPPFDFSFWKVRRSDPPPPFNPEALAQRVNALPEAEQEEALKLVSLANRRIEVLSQISREVKLAAKLKLWLFVHVPLTFALIAALAVHIVAVLFFKS